jgi:hypothetical protein
MATKVDKVDGVQTEDEAPDTTVVASSSVVAGSNDMLALGQVDGALATKMHLVNDVSFLKMMFYCGTAVDDAGNR